MLQQLKREAPHTHLRITFRQYMASFHWLINLKMFSWLTYLNQYLTCRDSSDLFDTVFRGNRYFKSEVCQHSPTYCQTVFSDPQRKVDTFHPLTALWVYARDINVDQRHWFMITCLITYFYIGAVVKLIHPYFPEIPLIARVHPCSLFLPESSGIGICVMQMNSYVYIHIHTSEHL